MILQVGIHLLRMVSWNRDIMRNACLGQGEDVFILRIQSPPEKGNGTYIVCWGGDCTPQASSDNMTIDAYRGWAVIENVCPCLGILIRMVVCLIPRGFMRSCSLSWICWVGDVVRIRSHSCITMIANEENHGKPFLENPFVFGSCSDN